MRQLRFIAATVLVLSLIMPAVTFAAMPTDEAPTMDRPRPVFALPAVVSRVMAWVGAWAKLAAGGEATPNGGECADDDQVPPPPSGIGVHIIGSG